MEEERGATGAAKMKEAKIIIKKTTRQKEEEEREAAAAEGRREEGARGRIVTHLVVLHDGSGLSLRGHIQACVSPIAVSLARSRVENPPRAARSFLGAAALCPSSGGARSPVSVLGGARPANRATAGPRCTG